MYSQARNKVQDYAVVVNCAGKARVMQDTECCGARALRAPSQ